MFTPLAESETPEIGSYTLKHTAEAVLKETPAHYVTNGRLISAGAAPGLPIAEYERAGGPNLLVGVPEHEHDYGFRAVRSGQTRPQGHHYRPPGYEHLQSALAQCAAGEPVADRWVRPAPAVEDPAPFHDWMLAQADRDEPIGVFASDCAPWVGQLTLCNGAGCSAVLFWGVRRWAPHTPKGARVKPRYVPPHRWCRPPLPAA